MRFHKIELRLNFSEKQNALSTLNFTFCVYKVISDLFQQFKIEPSQGPGLIVRPITRTAAAAPISAHERACSAASSLGPH